MICTICDRGCHIGKGLTGACRMYRNTGNAIEEIFPDQYLLVCPISVETMPMLHFHPAAKFLQISTMGCNFDCPGCVSTTIAREFDPSLAAVQQIQPHTIVQKAKENACRGIAFLMNDPLAAFHTFLRVARKAKEEGLLVGCASNTYFTKESLSKLLPVLDFIHIGFKGYSRASYRECGAKGVEPVLRNLRVLIEHCVHVEVSCVHKRRQGTEVLELARHISNISRDIPFHVMRFMPLEACSPDLEPSIRESEELCEHVGWFLKYVYLFNSPGTRLLNTMCPYCGEVVVTREFYGPMGAKIKLNKSAPFKPYHCPSCKNAIAIRGKMAPSSFKEKMFEGGYPFTRALEILESILIAIGVTRKRDLVRAWGSVLNSSLFSRLHNEIQLPQGFLTLVADLGKIAGRTVEAKRLINYLIEKLDLLDNKLRNATNRPTVYYAMGKPWFCINAERMENNLVELAGGESLNRLVEGSGRPGTEISVEMLNRLNPHVIFISSLFSSPLDDFYSECSRAGIDVAATRNRRVHIHPIPVSDFGSPRWVLGLMHIANVLHPELFRFDIIREARAFYERFYHVEYREGEVNLSFGKPLRSWTFP